LLGLAMSGVGLRVTPNDVRALSKDARMFGPPGSYAPEMPAASHAADADAPPAELLEIRGAWPAQARDVLGAIRVPVHYRQAEHDQLWVVGQDEIDGFAHALHRSPEVDAKSARGSGHCIDFHHSGAAFQLEQLAFALRCAAQSTN
jgi:hypothetical protein